MNGIHDMGGMTGFGPVVREVDEPLFHENWERRVFAMMMLSGAALGPIDSYRHAIERMGALKYLQTTYYEHWLAALEILTDERGLRDAEPYPDTIDADVIDAIAAAGGPSSREDADATPRFAIGDAVVARNLNPEGHTRLPRYVRGRQGVIVAHHGNHVFPDTAAHQRGEHPQPLYSVRFSARELWGPEASSRDGLYIDLWESYLEAPTS